MIKTRRWSVLNRVSAEMEFSMRRYKHKIDLFNFCPSKVIPQGEYIAPKAKFRGRCATFQSAMKVVIVTGQCFGLMPVSGICKIDVTKLRFKFFSARCVYSILSIFGQCVMVGLWWCRLFKDSSDSSLTSNTSLVFYSSNCLTTVMFLRIAMKWPKLCQQISRTEAADPNMDRNLVKKCNFCCFLVLSAACLEHLLSDLNGFALARECEPNKELFEAFIIRSFPWIYSILSYNILNGCIFQILNLQCTFNWNFADLFVICISFYLISRLEQVNKRIIAVRGKFVPSSFWRTMREDYSRLTQLVRRIDDVIGGIIFISFANNLFFICLQLLHILADGIKTTPRCQIGTPDTRPLHGYEQATYFLFSFIFLVLRSLGVSLVAAQVHSASREPAQALYEVSSDAYCIEVQRFLDQIHGDTVALSGLNFFKVKRGLVLTIAGTIVTYELVLMQFTGVTPTAQTPV